MPRKFVLTALASVVLLVPSLAHAAPLSGIFTFSGDAANVRVHPGFIDWARTGNVFGFGVDGDIKFDSGTGDFAPLTGTLGRIEDLDAITDPVGVPFSEANFIKMAFNPAWDFTLEFINPGVGTVLGCSAVPGAVCTPFPTSPFTIVNDFAGGSFVGFSVRGIVDNGLGELSLFTGAFTTTFDDKNALELITEIFGAPGFVETAYAARFTAEVTPIPEPATLLLFGTGLAGLARLGRRRRD
jgi:hypothetical protein